MKLDQYLTRTAQYRLKDLVDMGQDPVQFVQRIIANKEGSLAFAIVPDRHTGAEFER